MRDDYIEILEGLRDKIEKAYEDFENSDENEEIKLELAINQDTDDIIGALQFAIEDMEALQQILYITDPIMTE